MTTKHEASSSAGVAGIHDHPVWDDLAEAGAVAWHYEMARSMYDDVRSDWEAARPAPTGYDPIMTLAIAVQETARLLMQDSLFAGWRGSLVP